MMEFIDIGANLLDPMYQGNYRGKERHEPDLHVVLQRALSPPPENTTNLEDSYQVSKIMITAGTLQESQEAMDMIQTTTTTTNNYQGRLFSTVGVHPTRCLQEFCDSEQNWMEDKVHSLKEIAIRGKESGIVNAMGELGLDYARTQFCPIDIQKRGFIAQLNIALEVNLPLFLHNRDTGTDLLELLQQHYYNNDEFKNPRLGGVVHSFDDTLELAQQFIDLGLYIGINGCSLKTQENLNVVKELPLEKLMIETDCPWCDIRATHAGFGHVQTKFPTKTEKKYETNHCVKGRYEPCHIIQVAQVIAGVKCISVQEVARVTTQNAINVFGLSTQQ